MARSVEQIKTPAGDPAWQVRGYAEVRSLLADQRVGRGHPDPARAARYSDVDLAGRPASGSESEYTDHGQWRKAMNKVFSPQNLEQLTPTVMSIAERLAKDLAGRQPPADLNEAFSTPLTSEVMCALLGVPTDDIALFRHWTAEGAQNSDMERSMRGIRGLMSYVTNLVSRYRTGPGDNPVSMLVRADQDGSGNNLGKIVKLVSGMLAFGRETPASVIDWGVMLLLTNPEQRRLLQEDPQLAQGAAEEVLRKFKPPAATDRGLMRYAFADLEAGGELIKAGDMVLLDVMAANHDPEVFPDPERFEITRTPNPHLTFGYGFCMCTFTRLARSEIAAPLTTLLSQLPGLRLDEPPDQLKMKDHLRSGGLTRLPVSW